MRHAPVDALTSRLGRIRASLSVERLDALVLTHLPNVRYLTGFAGTAALAVVRPSSLCLLTDGRYLEEVRAELGPLVPGLEIVPADPSYDEALAGVLGGLAPGRIGVEASSMTVGRHLWLTARLAATGHQLVPVDQVVERVRVVKDAHEQEVFRRAGRLLDRVMVDVLASVRAGMAERDVAADVEVRLTRGGFERPAFDTIVASGPNSARPHARPGDRCLAAGDVVVLDAGGVLDGYCVDVTRTLSVGPPADWVGPAFQAVSEAQEAAFAAIRPGVRPSAVDAAARQALAAHGLADAFVHSTGHGLGLEIHEAPRVGPVRQGGGPAAGGQDDVLEAGMVVTVEPGVYLAGRGGIRLEDDVLVTAEGCVLLTQAPRELYVVSR